MKTSLNKTLQITVVGTNHTISSKWWHISYHLIISEFDSWCVDVYRDVIYSQLCAWNWLPNVYIVIVVHRWQQNLLVHKIPIVRIIYTSGKYGLNNPLDVLMAYCSALVHDFAILIMYNPPRFHWLNTWHDKYIEYPMKYLAAVYCSI